MIVLQIVNKSDTCKARSSVVDLTRSASLEMNGFSFTT